MTQKSAEPGEGLTVAAPRTTRYTALYSELINGLVYLVKPFQSKKWVNLYVLSPPSAVA